MHNLSCSHVQRCGYDHAMLAVCMHVHSLQLRIALADDCDQTAQLVCGSNQTCATAIFVDNTCNTTGKSGVMDAINGCFGEHKRVHIGVRFYPVHMCTMCQQTVETEDKRLLFMTAADCYIQEVCMVIPADPTSGLLCAQIAKGASCSSISKFCMRVFANPTACVLIDLDSMHL